MNTDQQIGALTAEVGNIKDDVADMKGDIKTLLEFTQQARGSWKTVMAISGFAAAIGALAAKFLAWVPFK